MRLGQVCTATPGSAVGAVSVRGVSFQVVCADGGLGYDFTAPADPVALLQAVPVAAPYLAEAHAGAFDWCPGYVAPCTRLNAQDNPGAPAPMWSLHPGTRFCTPFVRSASSYGSSAKARGVSARARAFWAMVQGWIDMTNAAP